MRIASWMTKTTDALRICNPYCFLIATEVLRTHLSRFFVTLPKLAPRPTQYPVKWIPGALCPGIKWLECVVNHAPPRSAVCYTIPGSHLHFTVCHKHGALTLLAVKPRLDCFQLFANSCYSHYCSIWLGAQILQRAVMA